MVKRFLKSDLAPVMASQRWLNQWAIRVKFMDWISQRECATRIEKAGLSHRVKLNVGDAANLPFEDNFFDAIFTSFALELLEAHELPIVLHECQRVLKAGGRICVVSLSKKGKGNKTMASLYQSAYRFFPNLAGHPHLIQKALEEARFQTLDATQLSVWGLQVEIVVAQKP